MISNVSKRFRENDFYSLRRFNYLLIRWLKVDKNLYRITRYYFQFSNQWFDIETKLSANHLFIWLICRILSDWHNPKYEEHRQSNTVYLILLCVRFAPQFGGGFYHYLLRAHMILAVYYANTFIFIAHHKWYFASTCKIENKKQIQCTT